VDETLNFRGYTTMFYEEDGEKERWMKH